MTSLDKELRNPSLTREKLLDLLAQAVRSTRAGIEVVAAAPDELRILIDGQEHLAYLENLWRQIRDEIGEARLPIFQRHARALMEAFVTSESIVTTQNIIPIIKD